MIKPTSTPSWPKFIAKKETHFSKKVFDLVNIGKFPQALAEYQ